MQCSWLVINTFGFVITSGVGFDTLHHADYDDGIFNRGMFYGLANQLDTSCAVRLSRSLVCFRHFFCILWSDVNENHHIRDGSNQSIRNNIHCQKPEEYVRTEFRLPKHS